jgi:hypothetical protein
MKQAIKEAEELDHNYVGTEHILLALLKEKEGLTYEILSGIRPGLVDELKTEVHHLLGIPSVNYSLDLTDGYIYNIMRDKVAIGLYSSKTDKLAITHMIPVHELTYIADLLKVRPNE